MLVDPVALRLAVIGGLIGLGAGLFLPYLNVYFVQELGASPAVYGWISGASTLTRLGATLLAPAVAGRLGTVGAIAGTQLASVPFLLLLGFAPQLGLAALAFLIRGALMNMALPLQTSFTMGALRPDAAGDGERLADPGGERQPGGEHPRWGGLDRAQRLPPARTCSRRPSTRGRRCCSGSGSGPAPRSARCGHRETARGPA